MNGSPLRALRNVFWNFLALLTLTDTTLVEFQSSTTLLLMGGMLLLPGAELVVGVPFHEHLLSVMNENTWGALFLGLGLCQSAANMLRASYPRKLAAFINALLFGFIAYLASTTRPVSLFPFPVFTAASLVQAIVYLRIADARETRRKISSGEYQRLASG